MKNPLSEHLANALEEDFVLTQNFKPIKSTSQSHQIFLASVRVHLYI